MSDIKTDVDRIKQLLQEAEGIDLSNAHLASMTATRSYHQLKSESLQIIPYLITTIESLQEEIQVNKNVDGFNWKQQLEERERLQNCVQSLQREISSHAPDGRNYINGQYVDLLLKFESQKEEIEKLKSHQVIKNYTDMLVECNSYKAITELAVKGLKEIACLNVDSDYSAGTIARNTFSEIERLSHA